MELSEKNEWWIESLLWDKVENGGGGLGNSDGTSEVTFLPKYGCLWYGGKSTRLIAGQPDFLPVSLLASRVVLGRLVDLSEHLLPSLLSGGQSGGRTRPERQLGVLCAGYATSCYSLAHTPQLPWHFSEGASVRMFPVPTRGVPEEARGNQLQISGGLRNICWFEEWKGNCQGSFWKYFYFKIRHIEI